MPHLNTCKLSKPMKYNKTNRFISLPKYKHYENVNNKHKYDFTKEQCEIWLKNPEFNPTTGKSIKIDGFMYQSLYYAALAHGLKVDDIPKLTCKHLNWITLNERDTLNNYKFRHMIDCEKCLNKSLRFCLVHDDDGDYICFRCGESVSIRYRCFNWNCKHSINEDKAVKNFDACL